MRQGETVAGGARHAPAALRCHTVIPATAGSLQVDDTSVTFQLADSAHDLLGVRLVQDVGIPEDRLSFRRSADSTGWQLQLDRPPMDRLEYLLELHHADGRIETGCDPGNPQLAGGVFGGKSVVEFPGYLPPAWLGADPRPGRVRWLELPTRALHASVNCLLWSSADAPDGVPLPLLVVHDGPEYAEMASLLHYLEAMVGSGRLPEMRAALLAPVDRDAHYTASPAYARALALALLPALEKVAPTPANRPGRIGMGASMGALAMLYAQRRHPGSFDGLFLQSGSFFQPGLDDMELAYPRFARVSSFVRSVLRAGPDWSHPVPTLLTCGSVEENLANNTQMARALAAQGYGGRLHVHPDGHNWVSWRDVFDPCLTGLAVRVWG